MKKWLSVAENGFMALRDIESNTVRVSRQKYKSEITGGPSELFEASHTFTVFRNAPETGWRGTRGSGRKWAKFRRRSAAAGRRICKPCRSIMY